MESSQLRCCQQLRTVAFHFAEQAVVNNQIMSHAHSMWLFIIQTSKISIQYHTSISRLMLLGNQSSTDLHWMSLPVMVVSHVRVIEVRHSSLAAIALHQLYFDKSINSVVCSLG